MKHGDFTELAKYYHHRPAFSGMLIDKLVACINTAHKPVSELRVVEVGAGTGKLTKMLDALGMQVTAVEPNDNMRSEGMLYTKGSNVVWKKGSGEETGVESHCADWVVMANSFHWTDPNKSLPEFARILDSSGGGGVFYCYSKPSSFNCGIRI